MARINTSRKPVLPPQGGVAPRVWEPRNSLRTHEGAPAAQMTTEQALRRAVCSCLLWESEFYESGTDIATRIQELAAQVQPKVLADLAYDARTHFNLRHVPLLLCSVLARTGSGSRLVSETLVETIQRPDELTEFLAIYAKVNGVAANTLKPKLSHQVRKGLAAALNKFDTYQLAKYDREGPVRLRDVINLSHAKPSDEERAALYKRILAKETIIDGGADTWETALSAGADKRETWERLLRENKLGYLALLRNLRNMTDANVDRDLMREAIVARRGARRVLPFRYVAAARACPAMAKEIDDALQAAIADMKPLPGTTVVLVDVSGSMDAALSRKSDLTRMDAAAALAAIIPGDVKVYTFSYALKEVRNCKRGIMGIDQVIRSQPHGGTDLGGAIRGLESVEMDRLIVITDEQSHTHVPNPPAARNYLINVASYQNGVGYGERWVHLDGFSEQVLRFIGEFETFTN